MSDKNTRITMLQAENIKRLRAVTVRPDPKQGLVIIGGDNAQGKSSLLDSIQYAMAGKRAIPANVVRHGSAEGEVTIELDNGLIIERKVLPDGKSELVVSYKDGGRLSGPQTILNEMYGSLSFDPLEFSNMPAAKQLEVVREMTGLDFAQHDRKREALYNQRRDVNRDANRLRKQREAYAWDSDAPPEEVSVQDLYAELKAVEALESGLEDVQSDVEAVTARIAEAEAQIKRLQELVERDKGLLNGLHDTLEKASAELKTKRRQDEILTEIEGIEEINNAVRRNKQIAALDKELEELEGQSECLTANLEKMDTAKAKAIADAKLPVPGLSFDSDGLYFNGVAFSECSGAEKLRVSVAMSAAANPNLRVLLVRDGSLLDDKSLTLLAALAEEHDLQVWLERVGDKDPAAVVIEDGTVRQSAQKGD